MTLFRPAVLLLLLLLAACQTVGTGGGGFTRADVLDGFGKTAFDWEFSSKPRNYIVRHGQPLQILLLHEPGDGEAIASFRRVMDYIRGLHHGPEIQRVTETSLPDSGKIEFGEYNLVVMALGPANYERVFEPMIEDYVGAGRNDMADLFFFHRCFARIKEYGGTISFAFVMMDVDQVRNRENYRELDECMAEEMLQTLGLPNDHDSLAWSMFNDSNRVIWPGEYDRLLLSLLYAPEIRPGMNREIAEHHLPVILDRIWPAYEAMVKKRQGA